MTAQDTGGGAAAAPARSPDTARGVRAGALAPAEAAPARGEWVAIQHVEFEGPGAIAREAAAQGIALRVCRPDRGEGLPDVGNLAGLVVMGGPMGVSDTQMYPWLADEIELVGAALARGLPVLGVCLGAQLLAAACGARVYRGPAAEIGPGTVTLSAAGRADPVLGAAGGEELPVVHWHGETFDLPEGATRLAASGLYPNQAFRAGASAPAGGGGEAPAAAYGLQFHIELDAALLEGWREHLPAEVQIGEQTRAAIEAVGSRVIAAFFARAGTLGTR
jgi:GMP synthase (glutamine-hydrolysing)